MLGRGWGWRDWLLGNEYVCWDGDGDGGVGC